MSNTSSTGALKARISGGSSQTSASNKKAAKSSRTVYDRLATPKSAERSISYRDDRRPGASAADGLSKTYSGGSSQTSASNKKAAKSSRIVYDRLATPKSAERSISYSDDRRPGASAADGLSKTYSGGSSQTSASNKKAAKSSRTVYDRLATPKSAERSISYSDDRRPGASAADGLSKTYSGPYGFPREGAGGMGYLSSSPRTTAKRKKHKLKATAHQVYDVFPDDPKKKDNLKFYSNEIASKPFPGTKIEVMLTKWKGDYHKLEYDHQFIQWLFPLPEGKGLNSWAQALQQHEAIAIQSEIHTKIRVLKAYKMMLDFYGMKLVSPDTGEVDRAEHYEERFQHLNRSHHNYRRITRIIKSIGYLGYGHLQAPLVKFVIKEAAVKRTLPNMKSDSMHHWIDAIADTKEREETMKYFLDVTEGADDLANNFGYDIDVAQEALEYDVDTGHYAHCSADRRGSEKNVEAHNFSSAGASNSNFKMDACSSQTSGTNRNGTTVFEVQAPKNTGRSKPYTGECEATEFAGVGLSKTYSGEYGCPREACSPRTVHDEFPDDPKKKDNLKFYMNKIKSKPFPGTKIEDMLKWKGDYDMLENDHEYIQWLFPLPEGTGINDQAQELQQHEAIKIQSDEHARVRVLAAYKMMLDFYGMKLVHSGEVARAKHYQERFYHLDRSARNYMRITRIIKSIGHLGYTHLQAPLVKFIIREAVVEETLPNMNGNKMQHWIDAIADTKEREEMMKYFLEVNDKANELTNNYGDYINGTEACGYDVDTDYFLTASRLTTTARETAVNTDQNGGLSRSISSGRSTKDPTVPAEWT